MCFSGANARRSRPTRHAHFTFECRTIPAAEVGGGLVGALKKRHQRRFRVARTPHGIVGQHKLPRLFSK